MNELNNPRDVKFNLIEILLLLWSERLKISMITLSFVFLTIVYVLFLPNIYTSKALLIPSQIDDTLSGKLGQFSPIQTVPGFNLLGENATKSDEAIERIKSFEFFSKYFLPYVKLEDLVAVKSWNKSNNEIIYQKKLFKKESKQWIKQKSSIDAKPSNQKAFKVYKKLLSISEEMKK